MKSFIFTALCLVSYSAFAADSDVVGRATLTLFPNYGGGFYSIEVRQEGHKFLGKTFSGNGLIDYEVSDEQYSGVAGGAGSFLKLDCSNRNCNGVIAGETASFSSTEGKDEAGTVVESSGTINFYPFTATRSSTRIEVSAQGAMTLTKTADGEFEGQGALSANPRSAFRATLKTEGTLKDLADDVVFAGLFVAPFTGR